MDVRIGYSVNLDKVPEKVADMLSEISLDKAAHLASLAAEMIALGRHEVGLSLLEGSRKELANIDRSLNEAQMILSGYQSAKDEPEAQESPIGEADAD
jgi:hypothetical protein